MDYGMTLRKLTKYLLAFLLLSILSLTGCKSDNKVHIKFSTWGSETEVNILKPLIKDFEKENPEIKVELMHIPQNYFQKLHMLVAANLTPDVIFINNFNIPIYASGNALLELDNNINNSHFIDDKDFYIESLETLSYKKKLYAIPRDISNIVIYYNKDLFKKYKVKEPDSNWNYETFLQTAKKLTLDTNNNNKIDLFGASFETIPIYFLPFAWSNGGELFDNDNKKFMLWKPPACQGLQFYANLRNKYHVAPKAYEAGNNTMAQLFMQQRVAMYISGRWNVPKFREDLKFNWDIINFPAGEKGSIVGLDGSGWAISSKSKHPKEAWKFVEYLASRESINKLSQTGLIVPARSDIANSETFLNKNLPPKNAKIFLEIIHTAKTTPKVRHWNEIMDLINTKMEPVWNGKSNTCKTLKEIDDDVNQLLE